MRKAHWRRGGRAFCGLAEGGTGTGEERHGELCKMRHRGNYVERALCGKGVLLIVRALPAAFVPFICNWNTIQKCVRFLYYSCGTVQYYM